MASDALLQNYTGIRLVPLCRPQAIGLPFSKRTLNRRLEDDADFPPTYRIGGKLFAEYERIEEYKRVLMQRGAMVVGGKIVEDEA